MKVIVTNAKNRIAYNVVRSLGQKRIEVHSADFVKGSMSFYSRYSTGSSLYPSPFRRQADFIECLQEKCRSLGECLVIPVFEETFLIAKFKNELSRYARLVIPDYELILAAHNKDRWQQRALELGIPVPASYSVESLAQGKTGLDQLRYPVLIKPKQGGGGWGISQVDSARDLERCLSGMTADGLPWDRFFVQEKITGETHCVAMLLCQGERKGTVAYKQLREYPVGAGQATLRVSLPSPVAENYLQRFLADCRWHGVCQADFVVDALTGTPYLVDLNPRLWGSLVQAIASGVDFPYLIYRIAAEGDVEPAPAFQAGVVTRWLGGDLRTFLPSMRRSGDKLQFAKSFLFPDPSPRLYDDISWRDPLPFCAWCMDAVIKTVKSRSFQPAPHDSLEGIWE